MDVYKDLASAVLGTPVDEITPEQRAQVKHAFWTTLMAVADLPDNEALKAVLQDKGLRFARLDWQSRWNRASGVASLSQSGAEAMSTGFFGVLKFRLDRPEDTAAIVNHARQFADMVERTAEDYASADIGG